MSQPYRKLLRRIEELRVCQGEDIEGFHVVRDKIVWELLNFTLNGDITHNEAEELRDIMKKFMRKSVWYA